MAARETFIIVLIIILIAYTARTYFRRCEYSNIPIDSDNYRTIYAPAYGKIVYKDKRTICIFLSLTDIHRQYFPVSGIITSIIEDYTGHYAIASDIGKSQYNDKIIHTIIPQKPGTISEDYQPTNAITITQIAGFLIRRIDYNYEPGTYVKAGEELGMIHFGSRVDISIPENAEFLSKIEVGQKIRAGDIIGRFKDLK